MAVRTTVVGSWWWPREDADELARLHADELSAEEASELLDRCAATAIREQRELGLGEWTGGEYFTYNFGDGWVARVSVRGVTPAEKRKIERNTKGFCGYDWMIDSIIRDGEILAEPRKKAAAA